MPEENKIQLAAKQPDPVEIEKKKVAWAGFGVQLYKAEFTLQLKAQEIIDKLIEPITPELIKQAEEAAAVAKKDYYALQQQRISVTGKFEPVVTRLSSHEKTVLTSIQKNQEAILKAKQDLKESEKTKEAKAKELKQVAEIVRVYVADMHAAYLAAQLKTLCDAYEYALDNNLSIELLPEFIAKVCARVNLKNRETPPPKPIAKYNTQEEVDAEVIKHFNPWPAQEYVDGFAADVELKFSDWQQALKDKPAAKELNAAEVSYTTSVIDDQKQKQIVAAHLESLAVPLTEGEDIKPLKQVWKISEPETIDEMYAIINAFAVNRHIIQNQIPKIKLINFGIKQMITTLIAVKTADENFECTGINFYKIEKL